MSTNHEKCVCDGVQVVTPAPVINPPNQSFLNYRVGTHSSFLDSMLAGLTIHRYEDWDPRDGKRLRASIEKLKTRKGSDPSIAFLDCWATIADVLSFYQQYIANEGFVATATERRSIYELARQVGYRLKPGLSASTYLAFNIDKNQLTDDRRELLIPKGTAAKTIGATPQTFETSVDIVGRPEWNELKPRITQLPFIQAGNINNFDEIEIDGDDHRINPNDYMLFVFDTLKPAATSSGNNAGNTSSNRRNNHRTSNEEDVIRTPVLRHIAGSKKLDGKTKICFFPSPLSPRGFAEKLIPAVSKLVLLVDESSQLKNIESAKAIAEAARVLLGSLQEYESKGIAFLDNALAEYQKFVEKKNANPSDVLKITREEIAVILKLFVECEKKIRPIVEKIHREVTFEERVKDLENLVRGLTGEFETKFASFQGTPNGFVLAQGLMELDGVYADTNVDRDSLRQLLSGVNVSLEDFEIGVLPEEPEARAIQLVSCILAMLSEVSHAPIKQVLWRTLKDLATQSHTIFKGWHCYCCGAIKFAFGISKRCLRDEKSVGQLKGRLKALEGLETRREVLSLSNQIEAEFKHYPIVSQICSAYRAIPRRNFSDEVDELTSLLIRNDNQSKYWSKEDEPEGLLDGVVDCTERIESSSKDSDLLSRASNFYLRWNDGIKWIEGRGELAAEVCNQLEDIIWLGSRPELGLSVSGGLKLTRDSFSKSQIYNSFYVEELSKSAYETVVRLFGSFGADLQGFQSDFQPQDVFDQSISAIDENLVEELIEECESQVDLLPSPQLPTFWEKINLQVEAQDKIALEIGFQFDSSERTIASLFVDIRQHVSEYRQLSSQLASISTIANDAKSEPYKKVKSLIARALGTVSLWQGADQPKKGVWERLNRLANFVFDDTSSLQTNVLDEVDGILAVLESESLEGKEAKDLEGQLTAIKSQLENPIVPRTITITSTNPIGQGSTSSTISIFDETNEASTIPDYLLQPASNDVGSVANDYYERLRRQPANPPTYRTFLFEKKVDLFGAAASEFQPNFNPNGTSKKDPWPLADVDNRDTLFLNGEFPEVAELDYLILEYSPNPELTIANSQLISRKFDAARLNYGLNRKCTSLVIGSNWLNSLPDAAPEAGKKPDPLARLRKTKAHIAGKPVRVSASTELLVGVDGGTSFEATPYEIQLDGIFDGIKPESLISVTGTVFRAQTQQGNDRKFENTYRTASEVRIVESTDFVFRPGYPGDQIKTRIKFSEPLANIYDRSSVVINGNVAPVTHGESKAESLGNGEGYLPNQKFQLSQSGITQLPPSDSTQSEPQLEIHVNRVKWDREEFIDRASAKAQAFESFENSNSSTIVRFGDGKNGAKLPDGDANLLSNYRVGVGSQGNVKPNEISQLSSQVSGLDKAFNPVAALGGSDPETVDQAKLTIPLWASNLDRLVSLRDYKNFAMLYPGVDKAVANPVNGLVVVTIALNGDQAFDHDSLLIKGLTQALKKNGGFGEKVRVVNRQLNRLFFDAKIGISKGYKFDDIKEAITRGLVERFGFAASGFGRKIYLNDFVSAVQSQVGVESVIVDAFGGLVVPDDVNDPGVDQEKLEDARKNRAPSVEPNPARGTRDEPIGAELPVFDGDKSFVSLVENTSE